VTTPSRPTAPIPVLPLRLEEKAPLAGPHYRELVRAFLIVCAIIVLTELTIMVLLEPLFGADHLTMAFVDSGTLILVCFPAIYFLLVKPTVRNLLRQAESERALRELQATNEVIRHDAAERTRVGLVERTKADARIQFQGRILAVVQQAVMSTGKGGIILYWNQYAEWMFGWNEQEVQGQTLAKVTGFTPEAASSGLSGLGAVKGWSGEVRAIRRNGTTFPAYLTCSPIWRPNGSVAGFVYTFLDITDRKSAEIAIRDSEEKYSTVVENSPTGIFIYRGGRLEFGNQRFFQMVGLSQQDLPQMDVADIVHPEDWPMVRELWQRRMAGSGASQDYECRIRHTGGGIRWISGRTALIRFGGEQALLGNIQDITERKKAEQEVLDSREALHKLSARLMSAQESERQRVARELHDSIGQSLSAVKFIIERAIGEQQEWGDDAQGGTLRSVVPVIQGAVEEVRRISMALRPTTLDDLGLVATIAWFVREFQITYPHMEVERLIEVEEFEVPQMLKTNIFRILQEAMNNAAKHSQATRIRVGLRLMLGDLQLLVGDNGVGFVPEETRRHTSSGGFGLVSMRERAELFGGFLIVTSSQSEGTMILARWTLLDDAIS
jgi:PAS domain S-box-containing protein